MSIDGLEVEAKEMVNEVKVGYNVLILMWRMGMLRVIIKMIDQEIEKHHAKKRLGVISKILEMATFVPHSLLPCFELLLF